MNKLCMKCKAVNDGDAEFCRYCGSALPCQPPQHEQPQYQQPPQQPQPEQPQSGGTYATYQPTNQYYYANYTPVERYNVYPGDIFGVPAREIAACVGKNSTDTYMKDFYKKQAEGKKTGFNILVFLLGLFIGPLAMGFWFLHRKINKIGAILVVVGIAMLAVGSIVSVPLVNALVQVGEEQTALTRRQSSKNTNQLPNSSPYREFSEDEFEDFYSEFYDDYYDEFNSKNRNYNNNANETLSRQRIAEIMRENGVTKAYVLLFLSVSFLFFAARIVLAIVCGIFANAWYLKDIIVRINKLKAINPSATLYEIERVGGTSCAVWLPVMILSIFGLMVAVSWANMATVCLIGL